MTPLTQKVKIKWCFNLVCLTFFHGSQKLFCFNYFCYLSLYGKASTTFDKISQRRKNHTSLKHCEGEMM